MSLSNQRPAAVTVAPSVETFLNDPQQVAAFTTIRPDGTLHVAPVRFTWDAKDQLARVLTVASSRKARNLLAAPGSRVALCQVRDFTWVSLEGTATVVPAAYVLLVLWPPCFPASNPWLYVAWRRGDG
ncbi:pyridoxamine 5'-phosphate oxidase family protein, partial [Dermacoccus nishinomiyaensis]|uniref:pyridoxamine 5'-phosphate oxidase family protein n=1 Tax=Dermacoccus nishinomiyaensis TaxID=1274 RepID=UPI0033A6572C